MVAPFYSPQRRRATGQDDLMDNAYSTSHILRHRDLCDTVLSNTSTMLACRTHPLFLSLLATYTVPPFSDYAIPRLRTRPCNVEYESTPSRLDSLTNNMVDPFGNMKARARSTWHTDRHTSSLQHLVHDLVSTMQPRDQHLF